jgi:biopolymer transport protein ExbB
MMIRRIAQGLQRLLTAATLGLVLTHGAVAQGPSTPATTPVAAATPAPDTAAAPAPVMPSAKAHTTKVDNPYGIGALWEGSDFVAKGVLLIMAVMSMGSWYIIVTKVLEQARINKQGAEAQEKFWASGNVGQGVDTLAEASPYRFIARSGLDASGKHEGLLGHIALTDWVTMSIQRSTERVQSRLQDGLAFLATVGSTAPFVGLFGTVWGIYHALTAIGVAGQASIDKVAGPVGEALIMTAIGLAVAVPAVLGYNWLVRRNKAAMDDVRAFGADLHAVLLSQGIAQGAR